MNPRLHKVLVFLGALLIVGTAFVPMLLSFFERGDVEVLLRAAREMWAGLPAYYNATVYAEYNKPPLLSVVFLPLALLPSKVFLTFWNLLNLFATPYCLWQCAVLLPETWKPKTISSGYLAYYALFFVLGSWIGELAYGQYNAIGLMLLMMAAVTRPVSLAGALIVVSILLKPTNLVLVPWVLATRPSWKTTAAYSVLFVGIFALAFVGLFGGEALVRYHREYQAFAPITYGANITKPENFGLIALVVRRFPSLMEISTLSLVGGFVLALGLSARWKNSPLLLPGLCLLTMLTSPMLWFRNFILAGPIAVALVAIAGNEDLPQPARSRAGMGLAVLYLTTQLYNPALLTRANFEALRPYTVPLWGCVVAMVCLALAVRALRPSK